LFLTVPAAVACVTLARPLANAVSLGEMASGAGVTLIAASITALGPSVLGESGFLTATFWSYARHDARSPFHAMSIRSGGVVAGMLVASLVTHGAAILVTLGLFISASDLVAAWYLASRARTGLPRTGERFTPALLRSLLGSLLMAGPAFLVATLLPNHLDGRWAEQLGMLAAVVTGIVIFVGSQWLCRSPELSSLISGFGRRRLREGIKP
jgi:peptidoglycan biosynthesis protein MviN/MurJ (putative lipid II flippase)